MLATIIGTAVGFIIATIVMSGLALALCTNKRFMGWYMMKTMAATKEAAEKIFEDDDNL